MSHNEQRQADQALERGEAGHHQIARPESPAYLRMAKVAVCAPDSEHDCEGDKSARSERVEEDESVGQLMRRHPMALVPEIRDRVCEAFLQRELRLPAELVFRTRVVEGDAENVALASRAKIRLEHPKVKSGPSSG